MIQWIEPIRTNASGWAHLMLCISIPMAVIGILRFFFVKETVEVQDNTTSERVTVKDTLEVLRRNPYVWMVGMMYFGYMFITGMGINTYYFTWVIGDLGLMGTASLMSIVVLPLLFFFPLIMKKLSKGKLVQIACYFYIASGLLLFFLGKNVPVLFLTFLLMGVASLPITYLTDLMMLDVGTYNQHIAGKRMDGTIGAIKGFLGKVGGAVGIGIVGVLLQVGGYDGTLAAQPERALFMIRFMISWLPVIVFTALAVMMIFYKLDKMLPELDKEQHLQ